MVAVCGAEAPVTLDGAAVLMWQSFGVKRGQVVKVGATTGGRVCVWQPRRWCNGVGPGLPPVGHTARSEQQSRFERGDSHNRAPVPPPPCPRPACPTGGSRAYIAIAGGLDVPEYLGSKSTFPGGVMGGHQGRPLRPGDMVPLGATGTPMGLGLLIF